MSLAARIMDRPVKKRTKRVKKIPRGNPMPPKQPIGLEGRERYVHNIVNGGPRTLRRVPSLELFTCKDWAAAIEDADRRLRAYSDKDEKTPLEILEGRLRDQKTRWSGLKGAVHFDVVLLDEPTTQVKPHRIGLIALAHMDDDTLHKFGLVTEIAYRNPSIETDILPRGNDVPLTLAYIANSIMVGRELNAQLGTGANSGAFSR